MTNAIIERLEEYASATAPLSVDEGSHIIHGVKILGSTSRNGRRYPESTIRNAARLYEGARVYVDHAAKADAPRSYKDRLGTLESVRVKAGGLFANLRYNPKHPLSSQLAWDAQHSPESVGLSHCVSAKTKREGGTVVVESIEAVHSVDIVAEPACTAGLFENTDHTTKAWQEMTAEQFGQRVAGTEKTGADAMKRFTDAITE